MYPHLPVPSFRDEVGVQDGPAASAAKFLKGCSIESGLQTFFDTWAILLVLRHLVVKNGYHVLGPVRYE